MNKKSQHSPEQSTAIHGIHIGIAEAGKVEALAGRHTNALQHYREAMRLAVSISAPEVFFRHYTQCTLESLELSGDFDEVINFCKSADEHYSKLSLGDPLHARDHAGFLERLGLVALKAGYEEKAKEALEQAKKLAGDGNMPLTEVVLSWLSRRLTPDIGRIVSIQKRYKYFTVRRDQVDKSRATPMPNKKGASPHRNEMNSAPM